MLYSTLFLAAVAAAAPTYATTDVPSLEVPACPAKGSISYAHSVPDKTEFPRTKVDLCYDDEFIHMTLTALNETNFYYNSSYGTNDNLWEYEVMEAFISKGTEDPSTYLEFEIAPNNVTWQAFVYNPSKVRADGAPFDHLFLTTPIADGLTAETSLNRAKKLWVSDVLIPLALFNVDKGQAQGTDWRMNFLRTVVAPETFPDQWLGAWSPPDEANFHMTPFFGKLSFV
jgi:hypothetical protein